jgi:hypothetical protein
VAPRPVDENLGYAQIRDESERTRHQRTPQGVPDDPLGVHGRQALISGLGCRFVVMPFV